MYRDGEGFCGGQAPYSTAATDIIIIIIVIGIRLVGIVTRLWAGRYGIRISAGTKYFSLLHSFQTGSGVHPASFSMGTVVPFRG